MKVLLSALLAAALLCLPASAQTYRHQSAILQTAAVHVPVTYHIRHDGGSNTVCNGLKNAAAPSTPGTAPADCAYNHPYQMLNWNGGWTSFTTGDTMEFDDPPTNTTPYYMGEQNAGVGTDWHGQIYNSCYPPNSPAAQGASCVLPILPSGVTIKGQNYGSCHTANHTGLVNPTILSGINGAFAVLQVQGTSNVTISCIQVTQPDNCTSAGTGAGKCSQSSNYVSYAGLMLEYQSAQGPANMTLTDFAAIGLSSRGILGSHLNLLSTDTFNSSHIYLYGNGMAGWDGDGGSCSGAGATSCESVGTMNISYADIELNGCLMLHTAAPYDFSIAPSLHPFNYCNGQNTSGYGDGFVQVAAGNLILNVDHSIFKYNTQDGFDAVHLNDDPNTNPVTNITNSWAEGNAGQTFKIGAGASAYAFNNVSIANNHILANAAAFPNNPSGWQPLDAGDTGRASGDQWALTLRPNTRITLDHNTSLGYGTTMYDINCSPAVANCNGGKVNFTNNISKGYPDPGNSTNQLASGIYWGPAQTGQAAVTAAANLGTMTNNLWSTMRTGCPNSTTPSETGAICADPILASESNIDAIDPTLTAASPAGVGASLTAVATPLPVVTPPVVTPPPAPAIKYPLSFTIQIPIPAVTVPVPATTSQLSTTTGGPVLSVTLPATSVTAPAKTLNCAVTQASAGAPPLVVGVCK